MNEVYQGIPVQSYAEIWVLDWLFELKDRGFIYSIERAPEMLLSPGLVNSYIKRTVMKTKTKEEFKSQTLIDPHYYTADFVVLWTPLAVDCGVISSLAILNYSRMSSDILAHPDFWMIGESHTPAFKTYIEAKPDYEFQDNTRRFMVNQKWMWEHRKVYINLLRPHRLFKSTFTPEAFLKTRKKQTERLIKWKIITCDEYLKSIGYEVPATL